MQVLEGIKVVDLSRVLAGPFCTQMLADLGAEVWKVESLEGDDTRHWGPPFQHGESAYFLSVNRGKKSLAVNLKDPRGAKLVRDLAGKADVLVENFKHGGLQCFGLGYEELAKHNPRLVYASITGFGQTGPRADQPGYDVVLEALSGIMQVTGAADGPPAKVGVAWIDVMTGMMAAVGVLAALHERHASGRGQYVDLGMFDVAMMAMVNQAQSHLMTGAAPQRMGNAHPQIVPYQTFQANDGWFMLAVGNDEQYRRLTQVLGRPDLWNDARYQSNAGRVQARDELVTCLAGIFRDQSREHWVECIAAAGIPVAPVRGVDEAFADAQTSARNILGKVMHPGLGELPMVANALQHMSRTPAMSSVPPPMLGQHSRTVLAEQLGVDEDGLRMLVAEGVIKA